MKNSRLTDGIWMNDDKTLHHEAPVWLITFPALVALERTQIFVSCRVES